jgi:hypothetical protein
VGTPNAGSAGAGAAAVNGIPNGPANAQGLSNSGNDPSGAGNAAKVASPSGNNGLGTASSSGNAGNSSGNANAGNGVTGSSGSAAPASGSTVGSSGVRSNGMQTPGGVGGGPTVTDQAPVDAKIEAENRKVDAKVKSICKGC